MARITVEDCLTKETNRFALIHLASKRTKQLLQGATIVLGEECDNKAVVTSLREIAEGKVRFLTEEEAARLRELNLEEQVPGLEPEVLEKRALETKSIEEKFREASDQNGHTEARAALPPELLEDASLDDDDEDEEVGEDVEAEDDSDDSEEGEVPSKVEDAKGETEGAPNSADETATDQQGDISQNGSAGEVEKKDNEVF